MTFNLRGPGAFSFSIRVIAFRPLGSLRALFGGRIPFGGARPGARDANTRANIGRRVLGLFPFPRLLLMEISLARGKGEPPDHLDLSAGENRIISAGRDPDTFARLRGTFGE